MTLDAAVAAELRAERAALGTTYEDIATQTGISIAQVYRFMGGYRSPNVGQLEALAHALGLSALDVMVRAQKRLPQ